MPSESSGMQTAPLCWTKLMTRGEKVKNMAFRLSAPYVAQWVAFKSIEIVTLWRIHSSPMRRTIASATTRVLWLFCDFTQFVLQPKASRESWDSSRRTLRSSLALSHCQLHENKFFNWIIECELKNASEKRADDETSDGKTYQVSHCLINSCLILLCLLFVFLVVVTKGWCSFNSDYKQIKLSFSWMETWIKRTSKQLSSDDVWWWTLLSKRLLFLSFSLFHCCLNKS